MPITPSGSSRRELLKLSPLLALGAFAVPSWTDRLLRRGLDLTDRAAGLAFRSGHAASTFSDADLLPFERFPYNYYRVVDPGVDLDAWALRVGGAVDRPGAYTIEHIRAMPKVVQNSRLICVEGWEAIGRFGGVRLRDFLAAIGADARAGYLTVTCADGYYESLDIETARHDQSLLCHEMYDQPLDRGHGAPLRLQLPTKLGYKQAKYLMTLDVVHELPAQRSLWADAGYSWYAGL